jgi:hypothetical protein
MHEQILDIAHQLFAVAHRSILDRRFQARRKGKSAGRKKTVDEAETLDQRKSIHIQPSAISYQPSALSCLLIADSSE